MIDLTRTREPVPAVHVAEHDPGTTWRKSPEPAIDAPADDDLSPAPDARWPRQATRTGLCGSVSPRVMRLGDGTYRMYYTQILPRAGNPTGANDYGNATTRILSANSADGATWSPDAGVRLSAADGGAGDFRVVSSEVGPAADGSGRLRMYFECCPGSQEVQNSIRSAVSDDGLAWEVEPGDRLRVEGSNIMAPRILFLGDGRLRMYVTQRGVGIVSAISHDGMTFAMEPGPRFPGDTSTFAPDLVVLPDGRYRIYFVADVGDRPTMQGGGQHLMTALSADGLNWERTAEPVLSPGGAWDRAKSSEMCVFPLPTVAGQPTGYGMVYEGCDGTTPNARGVWRVAAATSADGA
ncbi:MAG: hypothetical protein OXJ90_15900 [Spirochaetaceae bacterium]|nr:hypothetical protein [Spirochaetaceae bacterium]